MTRFPGFDLADRTYRTRQFTCRGCPNVCRITEVRFGEERPFYYGARCDRYEVRPEAKRLEPDLFRRREAILFNPEGEHKDLEGVLRFPPDGEVRGRVGVPRALLTWDLFPFFREFFRALGYEVVLSPLTHQGLVRSSLTAAPATACLPVKVVHGHVEELVEAGIDRLFLPALIDADHPTTRTKTNYNCPLVQAQPYILSAQFDFRTLGVEAITDPIHFYPWFYGKARLIQELGGLARRLGAGSREAERAIAQAMATQREAQAGLRALGEEALARVAGGALGVVVLSRSYNGCDRGLNLTVPEKLAALGALPIPVDALPWEEVDVDPLYPFMQWHGGKRILAAAEIVRRTEGLWAVHLSHFNCGPDSFIAHYLREALRGKPFLTLELDEHSADAGVITRLEAYLDSVAALTHKPRPAAARPLARPRAAFDRTKTIYLPYMCDHNHAFTGALRRFGFHAETLPPPDEESLTLGRKHSTGGECLPFILTTGDFLKLVRRKDFNPARSALFMPTSSGPCRFCHYFAAQRLILERLGCAVDFISLEAYGGYTIEDLGTAFRRTAWYGIVAVDFLQKLLWRTRPYEAVRGTASAVYREALRTVEEALAQRGIKGLLAVLPGVVARFSGIELRPEERPLVGIVGEIYVRANPFSNAGLVDLVEELGGEVRIAPVAEWLNYSMYKKQGDSRVRRDWPAYFKARLERYVLRHDEHRVAELCRGAVAPWEAEEPTTPEVVRHAEPYISEAYRGEPVLTVGKAIDYALTGFDGIINVMPFSCMPGTMVAAVSTRAKRDHGIPWLNLTFDGQEQAHLRTRLEAFLHQADLHRRVGKGG
ncbi:MAG: acyl-CoA dehydratase activase-related protein [Candidatus Acetothermia bacterium]|jgi:predicted nucleotide-binding protein (sugar kinase/HSP70/actin superfamily)|nr:acyl-CoA dehydratase activase-related protein [Candidatus Acetothermia bacterium]